MCLSYWKSFFPWIVVLLLPSTNISINALKLVSKKDSYDEYHVEDERTGTVLFTGGAIAVFVSGKWCLYNPPPEEEEEEEDNNKYWTLSPQKRQSIHGTDPVLGAFAGEQVLWSCHIQDDADAVIVPIQTRYKNFHDSSSAVLMEVEWPEGATNTSVTTTDDSSYSTSSSMTRYPSLQVHLPHALSWQGSFAQSVRGLSEGTQGGPTVFYNGSEDPTLQTVVVGSPWKFVWKSFSAGDNRKLLLRDDTNDESTYWVPGTSGRIEQIPKGYRQSILLYQKTTPGGGGITATMDSWGQLMQKASQGSFPKLPDVTLEKIGYQTDNGAMYCFCKDRNCSQTLLQKVKSLQKQHVPMGYLSFQGAGASSGRGKAAPWCVDTWGVDGGMDPSIYPMDLNSFQKALGLPLQLYAPYFCPGSPYFNTNNQTSNKWKSVSSDTTLPNCKDYDFENVQPDQSRAFYDWFLDKGIQNAGMKSFETDFMNQNYNCVPAFIHNVTAAQEWQQGMAQAALARGVAIQWCYATPTDVLASLDMPAVTNFRVSFDFCYGQSWNIGESSLLVWALGAVPSKDTLWSTSNHHTAIPGCPWTADHEDSAAELHVVLALMSNGPVGLSDAIGYTNPTLLQRIVMKDGTLLKPTKPLTAVDSTFLNTSQPILASGSNDKDGGYVYGTAGVASSWIFVSFLLPQPYEVTLRDFWPPPALNNDNALQDIIFAHRSFGDAECQEGQDAVSTGCVKFATVTGPHHPSAGVFVVPAAPLDPMNPGERSYVPTVTSVWQPCPKSRWILLGELSKYVPLSPVRFRQAACTAGGLVGWVRGGPGEVVALTALQPQGQPTNYTIVKKTIRISDRGSASFQFGGLTSEDARPGIQVRIGEEQQ